MNWLKIIELGGFSWSLESQPIYLQLEVSSPYAYVIMKKIMITNPR